VLSGLGRKVPSNEIPAALCNFNCRWYQCAWAKSTFERVGSAERSFEYNYADHIRTKDGSKFRVPRRGSDLHEIAPYIWAAVKEDVLNVYVGEPALGASLTCAFGEGSRSLDRDPDYEGSETYYEREFLI
jgi:hypothetical protein